MEERTVSVDVGAVTLTADLTVPTHARGTVVFAHGSGSTRRSSRNRSVAARLQHAGFATLLFDLLSDDEARIDATTAHLRFDIPFLAARLVAVTDWAGSDHDLGALPLGCFGASTGAAAALVAAAARPARVRAVVSRGGRPDLAGDALPEVEAPTLLLVGGADTTVLELNRAAARSLRAPHRIEVVAGAGHLFEEPGALEQVAALAADWFDGHLGDDGTQEPA